MEVTKVSLKLLIDTHANKVLFAEANKDFVDYLFLLLSLPIGTVVNLLASKGTVGCVADLHKSVASLSSDYWESDVSRESVLKPRASVAVPLLSLDSSESPANKKFYRCNNCCNYITDVSGKVCPSCKYQMSVLMNFVSSDVSGAVTATTSSDQKQGYVKGIVTYMILDNLEVKPMSTISGITLINKFKVKDVGALTEEQVQVGVSEGLEILKASLETQQVLSKVFLKQT